MHPGESDPSSDAAPSSIRLTENGSCIVFCGRSPSDSAQRRLAGLGYPGDVLPADIVLNRQVHSSLVVEAQRGEIQEADGLFSDADETALAVVTADCVPVLFIQRTSGRIAAVHAGWRGLEAGVLPTAVSCLVEGPSQPPGSILAVVGPCIGPCCYEVGWDVAQAVVGASGVEALVVGRRGLSSRPHLDLRQATRLQLQAAGVEDVRMSTICTRCHEGWCSFRRQGAGGGHNLACIWRHPKRPPPPR